LWNALGKTDLPLDEKGTTVAIAACCDLAPLMLYWEITRACDLACRHCRAGVQ